tara:strand:- start:12356 stop:12607 length:252 start_codon:yes stop_codon:yes gene_type:complete
MTNFIFNPSNVRIMNILTKNLQNHEKIYGYRMTTNEITVQSHYCANVVNFLNKKQFKTSVNGVGYLQMTKKIGKLEICFVFTD